MQSSVSLPSANIPSLGFSHQCTFLHYNTTYHKCHIYRQTQVTLISSVSEKWTPCNLKYVTLPWCVLEHLTRSPKYVTPPAVIDFFGAKNARAALISPSKRQKRHRGRDRTKIRQSWEVAGWNFLNSQTALAGQKFLFLISYFWKFVFVFPIGSLGKSFGSSKTFNSFVSARANINVYPSLERVLYLFVYDRLTWLSRLKPAV